MPLDLQALKKRKVALCGQSRSCDVHISRDELAIDFKAGRVVTEKEMLIELMRNRLTELNPNDTMALILRSQIYILDAIQVKNSS